MRRQRLTPQQPPWSRRGVCVGGGGSDASDARGASQPHPHPPNTHIARQRGSKRESRARLARGELPLLASSTAYHFQDIPREEHPSSSTFLASYFYLVSYLPRDIRHGLRARGAAMRQTRHHTRHHIERPNLTYQNLTFIMLGDGGVI